MKILHISAVKKWGGGENHLENLCFELKQNVQSTVFCVTDGMLHRRLKEQGIRFFTAPLANKMDPRFVYNLLSLCKKEDFDIIHIHDSTALTLTVMADHFAELPPFVLSKKTSFPIRTRKQTLYKYNYSKIKKILCVSEATKRIASASLEKNERLEVVYHGMRIQDKKPGGNLQKIPGIPGDRIIIGNIANHIEAKDLETFVRTADFLIRKKGQTNLHFVQIGSFSKRSKDIRDLVKQLGLQQHISFLGFIPEASAFIPHFNVNLITSENEGLPQVIYESFFYGIPVVSTNVGGIPEAIENGVNGFLSPSYDHKALGENILFLMENPQLIPNFAKISKEKLIRNFTSEKMAQKTLSVYKEVKKWSLAKNLATR